MRTYRKAVLGLAGLLLLCSNFASAALTIPSSLQGVPGCLPGGPPTLSRSGRWCCPRLEGGRTRRLEPPYLRPKIVHLTHHSRPLSCLGARELKRCAVAPSGAEACWELADPAMTAIPDGFLQANTNLTGTLRVGPAVQTIGDRAFFGTELTGLDLSTATSLLEIGEWAFSSTDLEGTLVIPAKLTTIGPSAFESAKLTGLDLSTATSLVEIGASAFMRTDLEGTLVIPAKLTTIGPSAFVGAKLTGLDLSNATSLVEIGDSAFYGTGLEGTLAIPAKLATIGTSAFADSKLTGLDLSKATPLVKIGDGVLRGNGS